MKNKDGNSKTEYRRERFSDAVKKIKKAWFKRLNAEKKEKYRDSRKGALVLLAALILFGLYYLGLYDFDLIERPESWQDNGKNFYSIWYGVDDAEKEPDAEPDADDTNGEAQNNDGKRKTVSTVEYEFSGRPRKNTGAALTHVFRTKDELASEGYYLTDAEYVPGSFEIGKIDLPFDLTAQFSYRDMATRTWEITKYDDGRMSTVEDTTASTTRPAIYLYMGYIIYDDCGKELYIVDRNGSVRMNYNENYLPAFARDSYGNPLFYTTYGYYADVPASVTKDDEGRDVMSFKGAYIKGKNYYALSTWGNYFASTDYIEERDGRGLNFDFPAYYGLSDTSLYRYGIMTPKYSTFLDGKSDLVNFMRWNYFYAYDPARQTAKDVLAKAKEAASAAAAEDDDAGAEKFDITELLPYSAAFNYSEGYATVVTGRDIEEEEKYHVEEVRVINTSGNVTFKSRKKYQNNDIASYCSDRYMLPLSKGEESVGHIYFDHGLMRLRRVVYDPYQLEEFKEFRVNMDYDVLVYPNGTEFPIPEGYTLKGYADGILTLERSGVYGFMNTDGVWIAEPEYRDACAFHGGIGVLTKQDGTCGAMDTSGNIVIPFRYSYISNRSDDLIAAYSEAGGWELFGVFTK
ncbi:MAG: WG repeat-containing protein [Clostridia bacterium]|nr:WG repeat-containing protein [Clostridia bacterium]